MKSFDIKSPQDLISELTEIFPDFKFEPFETDPTYISYHMLLQQFIGYFGSNNSLFSERQIKNFAGLVNWAVEIGGELENAFGTCFLEHLHQVRAKKPLTMFLSKESKKRLHA